MRIRPVQAYINKRGGGTQNAWEIGSAHDAIGGVMFLQQREHLLPVPAQMAEFQRETYPRRYLPKNIIEPRQVARHVRRELHEQYPALVRQAAQAAQHTFQPSLRFVKTCSMSQTPRCLDSCQEPSGHTPLPSRKGCIRRPVVESIIDLDRVKVTGVICEPARRWKVRRIKYSSPMSVAPPRCADMNIHAWVPLQQRQNISMWAIDR